MDNEDNSGTNDEEVFLSIFDLLTAAIVVVVAFVIVDGVFCINLFSEANEVVDFFKVVPL